MRAGRGSVVGAVCLALIAACGGDSSGPNGGGPPTISALAPAEGTVGTEIALTGSNFRPGAAVLFDSLASDSVMVPSSTTIYALVPAGVVAGKAYRVTVRNSDGSSAQDSVFTAVAPVLRYVNGATRPSGNIGSTVILEGQAFGDLQGTGQVLFSNGAGGTVAATIASPGDWTDGFIVTTVPAGAATGDVKVTTATGASAPLTFTITSNAVFSPSLISWTATTSLPVGLAGLSAAVAPVGNASPATMVYVSGGVDSLYAAQSAVYVASIGAGGQLGAWQATAPLPAAVAFHASVIATPYNSRIKGTGAVYVLGGTATPAGTPSGTVYRGTLDASGSVTTWSAVGSLPVPLHSAGAVIFRGDLYIAGGSRVGNAPSALVYRARIDSLGNLSAWQSEPSLPFARSYGAFGTFGGYLYVLGGDSAAVTPNDSATSSGTRFGQIAYAAINLRTGDLASTGWTVNPGSLTKAAAKHTAVLTGGNVLVSGGLYNGASTGLSEESYAQIGTDAVISSFNGATGAHTIASAGGGNLFNHAAVSYVDAGGVSHVMVLGGDDVNTPGKMHKGVWFY